MSEKIGSAHWDLDLDDKKFEKGISSSSKTIGSLKKRFQEAEKGSKILLGSLTALAIGFVAFGAKSVEAFNIQAQAEAKLTQLHLNRADATMEGVQALKDLATEVQRQGVVGDEAIISGQAQLATFKLSTEAIKELTPAMTDMVAQQKGMSATGDDFVNIGNLMGKVMEGNIGALGRYGVSFDENSEKILKNGTEVERSAELAKVLANNYGGVNAALLATPEGKLQSLKNRFGDLQESLGGFITKAMEPFIDMSDDMLTQIEDAGGFTEFFTQKVEENKNALIVLSGAILAALVPALAALAASAWATLAPLIPFIAIGAAIAFMLNKLTERFGGIIAVVTDFFMIFNDKSDDLDEIQEKMKSLIPIEFVQKILIAKDRIVKFFTALSEKFSDFVNSPEVQQFIAILKESLMQSLQNLKDAFEELKPKLIELKDQFLIFWEQIQPFVQVVAQIAAIVVGVLLFGFVKLIEFFTASLVPVFNQVVGTFKAIGAIAEWLWLKMEPIINNIVESFKNAFGVIKWLWDNVLHPVISLIVAIIAASFQLMMGSVMRSFNRIQFGVLVAMRFIKRSIINPIEEAFRIFMEKTEGMRTGIKNVFNGIVTFFQGIATKITNAITKPFKDAKKKMEDIGQGIKDQADKINPFHRESPSLVDWVNKGTKEMTDLYANMFSNLEGMGSNSRLALAGSGQALSEGISESGGGSLAGSKVVNITLAPEGIVARSKSDLREITKDMLETVNEELRASGEGEIGNGKLSNNITNG